MAKIETGLADIVKSGRIPAGEYGLEIKTVTETRKGWEQANCVISEAEDDELLGRPVRMLLLNESTGQSIGLQQLMTHLHWEELPEDEETGERDTKTVLPGVKFRAQLFYEDGFVRVRPVLEEDDWEWQRGLLGEDSETESEEEEEEEKPRSRKKISSSKSSKKKPPRR